MNNIRTYGEILFLGPCNLKCYYCLSSEMTKLRQEKENQLQSHFKDWKDFDLFLQQCKERKIDTIYLSSVTTDPMIYMYLAELINYLKESGFKVGIRTNGYFALRKLEAILLCDEEISLSMNSLVSETSMLIAQESKIPNWCDIFTMFRNNNKSCRVSIVVNKYNYKEIPNILDYLTTFKDILDYVQLRRVYKYYKEDIVENKAYNDIKNWVKANCKISGRYFESEVYEYKGIQVSLWDTVFKKESIQSVNYFTNGIVSTNNLLIPAYESGELQSTTRQQSNRA